MFKPGDIVKDVLDLPNSPKFIVIEKRPTAPDWALGSYILQNTVDGLLYEGFESQLVRLEEDGTWRGIVYEKEPPLCPPGE